jgi:2-keto-4-pentenoate hydratase
MTTDERIVRGMRRQRDLRDARIAAGARQVGWKVGFGSPAARASLGIDRPLVGFLLDTGMLADGATVPLGGWRNPMLEAEIAVHVDGGGAITGVSAAIELADVAPPPEDPEVILAGDVFTRHVVLGPVVEGRADSRGVVARIVVDGAEVASTDDVRALVGELADVASATAETLAGHGEQLRAGQFIMTGSVFPPLAVRPGQRVQVHLPPLGTLSVSFT